MLSDIDISEAPIAKKASKQGPMGCDIDSITGSNHLELVPCHTRKLIRILFIKRISEVKNIEPKIKSKSKSWW